MRTVLAVIAVGAIPHVPTYTLADRAVLMAQVGGLIGDTLDGSFSAVSTPHFASKYSLESS